MNPKTSDINNKLKELYEPYFDALCTKNNMGRKRFNPLLIKCPDEYFSGRNIRIMVIGKETEKWFKNLSIRDVAECQELYETFYKDGYNDEIGNGEECNFVKALNLEINNTNKVDNIVWTNVYKTSGNITSSNRSKEIYKKRMEWREMQYNITNKEIDILEPDFVFFITGDSVRNDTDYVMPVFEGQHLNFTQIKEDKSMAMVVGIKSKTKFICLRIPEPNGRDSNRNNNIIKLIKKIVVNYGDNAV